MFPVDVSGQGLRTFHGLDTMHLRFRFNLLLLAALLAVGCQTLNNDDPEQTDESWEPEETIEAEDRNPLLLVGIDGFKPSYLDTYEQQLPTLNQLADGGVRAESLKPVFPTHTFPNLYSIVSGLYPENHGVVANTFYDPDMEETMTLGDDTTHNDPAWFGGEPIWVTAENAGLTAATFFWVGSEAPIGGVRPTHYVSYDSSIPHRQRTDQVVEWLTDEDDPVDFATLYFASPDGAGHQYGTDSRDLAETLERVDSQIQRLIAGLNDGGLWPDVNILLVSDHGMTDLSDDKVIFLDDIIDMSDVWVVDWSPVAMIRPDQGKFSEVYEQLKQAEEDHNFSVYRRDELPERYRLADNDRVAPIVVIADKPYSLTSHGYYQDRGLLTGGHGFDPKYEQMHGFFIGIGPDLPDRHRTDTLKAVDLYSLMSFLLAVAPADNDGSFERIGSEIFAD